jgi:pimeloyl-ACP methyl ester carboxylesterase
VVEERIPLLFHPDHARDPALTEIARSMARETGPKRFLRQQRAIMGRIDSRPSLGAIRCPTLVVGGDADGVAPPAAVRELADGIPGARLEIIERCGHFMPLEQPAALNALLRAWLIGEWD